MPCAEGTETQVSQGGRRLLDPNSVFLPAPSCSSAPLDAVEATALHDWHDFHKPQSLLIPERWQRWGACPQTENKATSGRPGLRRGDGTTQDGAHGLEF